jgi:hypothetical protein
MEPPCRGRERAGQEVGRNQRFSYGNTALPFLHVKALGGGACRLLAHPHKPLTCNEVLQLAQRSARSTPVLGLDTYTAWVGDEAFVESARRRAPALDVLSAC